MARTSTMLAIWAIGAVLAVAGCGPAGSSLGTEAGPGRAGAGTWRELPGSPLGPREATIGLWTGSEVLLIGGSDESPCPPGADCPVHRTRLDGAALDPETGRWRRIADLPVPALVGPAAVLGQTAYLLAGAGAADGTELLSYRIDQDRWQRSPVPPFDANAGYTLVAAGDRLVAYPGTHEAGSAPDYALDPSTAVWKPLPAAPLGGGFDRVMVWNGTELFLFDHELISDPNGEKPAITRVAALAPATGSWRRLPDSGLLSTGPWLVTDGRLVNPTIGSADGGRVNNWGRAYPYGGSLDPRTGIWSPLPASPWADQAAGARGPSAAMFVDATGAVLDTADDRWRLLPALPDSHLAGATVLAAGTALLVFGGVRWNAAGTIGTLSNRTWLLTD